MNPFITTPIGVVAKEFSVEGGGRFRRGGVFIAAAGAGARPQAIDSDVLHGGKQCAELWV